MAAHSVNHPLRLAVLASGRGTNLQAVLDACADGSLAARVVSVHSDRPRCVALARAAAAGIPTFVQRADAFASRRAFDIALFDAVVAQQPDLVVCAGYMRLIDGSVADAQRGRMINIHPSLLPAFKGLHTHRRALAEGARTHGASVHFVTADLDGGPVIAQASVAVHANDDEPTLAARVLAVEHPLLLETLRWLAAGRVRLGEDGVEIDGLRRGPLQLTAKHRFA